MKNKYFIMILIISVFIALNFVILVFWGYNVQFLGIISFVSICIAFLLLFVILINILIKNYPKASLLALIISIVFGYGIRIISGPSGIGYKWVKTNCSICKRKTHCREGMIFYNNNLNYGGDGPYYICSEKCAKEWYHINGDRRHEYAHANGSYK